jgi:5'-nucleotidase
MRSRVNPFPAPRRLLISLFAALLVAGCSGDDGNNGLNSLVAFAEIPVGDAACPDGGTIVNAGLDRNRNGVLDDDEITDSSVLECRGAAAFALTLLHINDGESKLRGTEDFGRIDRFAALIDNLQEQAVAAVPGSTTPRGVLTLTSGDNTLAGPDLTAGFDNHDAGGQIYDAIALDYIEFDAMAIGNHDLDFGPARLADFIEDHPNTQVPFLSANLDVSAEPELADLAASGRIAGSVVVNTAGFDVGIVGATTEALSNISSPGPNIVINDVETSIQAEVDELLAAGVDKIVLISHLQGVDEDLDLITRLRGIDVAIAGGGDELLANDDDLLIPGDEAARPYPLTATDADGRSVPVVTTAGNYEYVGKLVVRFDEAGEVIGIDAADSGPVRVAGGDNEDAVEPDPFVAEQVLAPVETFVGDLAGNTIVDAANCAVSLTGTRGQVTDDPFTIVEPGVRNSETNQGNLIADALLWQGRQLAADFGAPLPVVGIQNGGGIRNDSVIDCAGEGLTELSTFEMLPFSNFVSIVTVPRSQFKELLENAVSAVESGSGRFAQVAGLRFTYDRTGTPREGADDGTEITAGSRVVDATLDDGTVIVSGGAVLPGADITIATIDFLARGGDQYPYRGLPFTSVGVSYQLALFNYLTGDPRSGALDGAVTAAAYPEDGEGRISDITP